ncbi:MAG: ATP-grasp domain-containing protein [bacterium]|nr:ATP-grasp domain-containing protein [bacterium]
MKKKTVTPLLGQVLRKIAPRIGATVVIEPEWKIVGQIIYKSGQKRYFRYSSLDLNHLGASEIAKDKDYANFFMKKMGYPIVPGSRTFYSNEWARAIGSPRRNIHAAYRYAKKLEFPVIVKPNSGSQGAGVALVHTKREFYRAMRAIFKRDRVALVQRQVRGNDYRLVVLDDRVISIYARIPLNVVGNGTSTIRQLVREKQCRFIASSRDTRIKLDDPRIAEKLKRQKLSVRSVPTRGERVYLLDNANLSTGGDVVDVTTTAHSAFRKIAVRVTKDMGLRLCGVDLMIAGDITKRPGVYWILEVNAAPGLDHYAQAGRAQERIVEDLYLEVLKSMEH